jgi:hypothetical protein
MDKGEITKITGQVLFGLLLLYGTIATSLGACDYTINVLAGQGIQLSASPASTANYDYLWTATPGITLPAVVSGPSITLTAPAYDTSAGATNHYEVTVLVTIDPSYAGNIRNTCSDSKTVCINVQPPACPLCNGNICKERDASGNPTYPTTGCPPAFDYTGHESSDYTYHYVTLSHTGYTGVPLYEGQVADYTLDAAAWAKLDQPTEASPHVCTDVQFYITRTGTSTVVGTPCTKTICLNWDPMATITPAY